MPIDPDSPDFVTSLARGLAVIRAFGSSATTLTLAEIAEATGLSRPTARRFLLTLEALGYVGSDGKRFWLVPRILDLGYALLSSLRLSDIAVPSMQRVVDRLNESCSMAVLDKDEVLYIARVAPRHLMSLQVHVGTRLPAYCNSVGRVLLAERPPAEIDAYLAAVARRAFTSATIVESGALKAVLSAVRLAGYALIDQEVEEGLRAIAVPIRARSGRAVAGLSVGAHSARVSKEEMVTSVLPLLTNAAREIEAVLASSANLPQFA